MSIDAYRQTQQAIAAGGGASLPAAVLKRCADDLLEAAERPGGPALERALERTRSAWCILGGDLTPPDSGLPRELRQNLATITMFMLDGCLMQRITRQPEALRHMAKINLEVAAGMEAAA